MATATKTPEDTLNELFPLPLQTGTKLSPSQNPGVTSEAAKALVRLLKDNHDRFHIFFNEKGFHNHSTHHLYAIYALGATPELLDAAYKTHVDYQRPAFDSPEEITESNWKNFYGNENYYRAYLKFFTKVVREHGIGGSLEKYVFEMSANFDDKENDSKRQPQMVNRMMSGVLHPLIHAGYGCEFEAPGMLVEGLAMACVTHTDVDALYPRELFMPPSTGTLTRLAAALSLSSSQPGDKGTHAFAILSRMQKDPALAPGVACDDPKGARSGMGPFMQTIDRTSQLLRKYAEEWIADENDANELAKKVEELSWAAVLLYGVTGLQPGKDFKADFFTMHLVTSSLLLHSYFKYLSPSSQSLLLRTYFTSSLAVWVSRGRPQINIPNFYSNTTVQPSPPGVQPTPAPETLLPENLAPNAWLPILQTTLMHPNEHLPKLQRALAHYASVYGLAEKGHWKEKETELEGAELLDGSLFVRVAGLTATALGWMREGQSRGEWAFTGFWS